MRKARGAAPLSHILTITILFPIAAAILVSLLPVRGGVLRWLALAAAVAFFVLTLELPAHFNYAAGGFQFETIHSRLYHVGVDGISLWLVVAIGLLAPVGVLASWTQAEHHTKCFLSLFLLQQSAMAGVFLSLNLFLYFAFWLLSLIVPTVLMAVTGRGNRASAARRFGLFTILPSLLLLASTVWLYRLLGTADLFRVRNALQAGSSTIHPATLLLVSLGFLVPFLFRVPIFPLHGWLARSFEEAPTAIAITLAGALGIYSVLRFDVELFPAEARAVAPWMIALATVGIVYGGLLALEANNMFRLAAYATLSSVSFCLLGIFCFTVNGVDGALYQALSQAVAGGALLVLIGFLRERYGSSQIDSYGGLAAHLPRTALFSVVTALAVTGLPLLSGFVGEFLVLSGAFRGHAGWATAATLGFVLSACYMFRWIERVFFGEMPQALATGASAGPAVREHIIMWPMMILMLAMGVVSPYWMRAIDQSVVSLVSLVPAAYRGPNSVSHPVLPSEEPLSAPRGGASPKAP